MFEHCLRKQEQVKNLFTKCASPESRYERIIELGRGLPPIAPAYRIPENLVKGCQSRMYLHSHLQDGKIIFEAESDSLISAGLAALLMAVYSDEAPEVVLQCPPTFLEDLQINASLTMNRANGLASLHLRMKQDALQHFIASQRE